MITLLGKKKGMGAVFDDQGHRTPVTVLEVGPCPVTQIKSDKTDGYNAVQIGFDPMRPKLVNKPKSGHFSKSGVKPQRLLSEFHYDNAAQDFNLGDVLDVSRFVPGDVVTVIGTSKGRGFAGVIKRHGHHRPKQSHGTHESFRGGGSIGQCASPSRVFPGMKMPGRYGGKRITVKNLQVVDVDNERGLMMVKGAVPGPNGRYISVRKARGDA